MTVDLKDIHLGTLIQCRVKEINIEDERICNFLNCTQEELEEMYQAENIDSGTLLRWSKLLEYDFFRLYSQHLILYSPAMGTGGASGIKKTVLPQFRKQIYTREIINFIVELYVNKQKSKLEIMEDYRIPKTTLHKWIEKYGKTEAASGNEAGL